MYRYTVTNVKDSGELTPPAVGWTLVETQYAPPDKLICIWMAGYDYDVEWGDTTWANREEPVLSDPGACG
jgi:hypothetical protein